MSETESAWFVAALCLVFATGAHIAAMIVWSRYTFVDWSILTTTILALLATLNGKSN